MGTVGRPAWRIEVKTGDREPMPEWLELKGYATRFKYVEREEAERMLKQLQSRQPHASFRIVPV